MRCRYCGCLFSPPGVLGFRQTSCPKCVRLLAPRLVVEQGDGVTGFREVMLGQNANEPARKLLETEAFHFTIYFDEQDRIIGFDLTDRDEAHLLKWRRGRLPIYYGVTNEGRGYHNRNEVFLDGKFASAAVEAELNGPGRNLQRHVRAVLLEGIHADQPGD